MLINTSSRSLTIDVGMMWRRATLATNALAIVTTVYGCFKATKWECFVNRSTITLMIVCPLDGGNPSIKFIETSIDIRVGTGSGWSNPTGFIQSVLYRWQISHYCKNSFIDRCILDQKKFFLIQERVLWNSKCLLVVLSDSL